MDNALYLEWFRFAEMDFYTAFHLMKTSHPKPLEIICYHCQQASEKWLKGVLAYHKRPIPRIHALDVLNEMLAVIDGDFVQIQDACYDLTDYSVIVRYPAEIVIKELDAEIAIQNATSIKNLLVSKGLLKK